MSSSEADTLLLMTSSHSYSACSDLMWPRSCLHLQIQWMQKVKLLPVRSRRGSCWLRGVRLVMLRPVGGETASDSRRHSGSVWRPARAAGCLLRLKPQWNPSTNPTDGPPLLHQPKHNSLSTTSPSLVELQDESLFQIFFFFSCREALFSSRIIWLTHFKI